jgi:NAD+ synthase
MKGLELDNDPACEKLVQFIREHTQKQGFSRVLLGLSGGLDSTVAAYLAVKALGWENLLGVFMPHDVSHSASLRDAQEVASALNIRTRLVDITPMSDAFMDAFENATPVQLGNVMARCRMVVLYQISAEEKALVMGTSNKSEILLGYGTLHGDLACAFNPLGDLYKTQIRMLAAGLGVPPAILKKPPSADLWEGQSDEGELGLTYAEADRLLVRWIDGGASREALQLEGFSDEFIDRVQQRVKSQRFKSLPPAIPKISSRRLSTDLIHPQDWLK